MIAIVDYGLGNINAFANVYKRLDMPFLVASTEKELCKASNIILPGVGSFDHAMKMLQHSGMREKLDELVLKYKIPVIGICVGMQMLAQSSEEGVLPGLGWIDGVVKKFDTALLKHKTRLPHMGWNTINLVKNSKLLSNLDDQSRFYFLHSYYFQGHNDADTIAITDYGIRFTSAVNVQNIYGIQFHPEKSHQNGVQVLRNFANL